MKRFIWLISAICVFLFGTVQAEDQGDVSGIKHRVATLEYYVDLVLGWIEGHEDENGSNFQVYDSEGKQVGEFLSMANPWNVQLAMVAMDVEGHLVMVRVSRPEIWWEEVLFFADELCQGPAYMPAERVGGTWFDPPTLISVLPGIPHSRSPHMPIELPPVGPEMIVAIGEPDGCRALDGPPPPSPEFIAVAPIMRGDGPVDLHGDFPPPYQLSD